MENNEKEIPVNVSFRIEQVKDVIAVIHLPFNDDPNLLTCYSHVGQHSSCHKDYITQNTRPATPEEYKDLLEELQNIGYLVTIID